MSRSYNFTSAVFIVLGGCGKLGGEEYGRGKGIGGKGDM